MKYALVLAVVIIIFILFRPYLVETFADKAAEDTYKTTMMDIFLKYSGGKKFVPDKLPQADQINFAKEFIVAYNLYAEKVKEKKITLLEADEKFPSKWVDEYNKLFK
jgi:hypothetical protein